MPSRLKAEIPEATGSPLCAGEGGRLLDAADAVVARNRDGIRFSWSLRSFGILDRRGIRSWRERLG